MRCTGELSSLGRLLISSFADYALCQKAGVPAKPVEGTPSLFPGLDASSTDITAYLENVRKKINLLNLMNGLNLTADQMGDIVKENRSLGKRPPADPARTATFRTSAGAAYQQALENAVKSAEKGHWSYKENGEDLARLRRARSGEELFASTGGSSPVRAAATPQDAAKSIYDSLTEAQRTVMVTYKPCLIPPKNLKDPVRVGQASDSSHAVQILERRPADAGPA